MDVRIHSPDSQHQRHVVRLHSPQQSPGRVRLHLFRHQWASEEAMAHRGRELFLLELLDPEGILGSNFRSQGKEGWREWNQQSVMVTLMLYDEEKTKRYLSEECIIMNCLKNWVPKKYIKFNVAFCT